MSDVDTSKAARLLLSELDKIWDRGVAISSENAREQAGRDGHGWKVMAREGFRAALMDLEAKGETE